MFKQCVLLVLTYGSETERLTKEQERKLRSSQRGMERKILGVIWRDRKRKTWIREQTKIEDILTMIKKKKWSLVGPIMRRTHNRWTKRVTEWQLRNCKRSQGREKISERDEISAFAGTGWSTLTPLYSLLLVSLETAGRPPMERAQSSSDQSSG